MSVAYNEEKRRLDVDKLICDFDNRIIIVLSSAQKDCFAMEPFNQKSVLLEVFPRKSLYMRANNFTFDYENSVIEANEEEKYDGINYDVSGFRVLDREKVEDLRYKRELIMDLLGFEVVYSDDRTEKYREYADFMQRFGIPPSK